MGGAFFSEGTTQKPGQGLYWKKKPRARRAGPEKEAKNMPCIQIKTNVPVSSETAETLKSSLGQAICCLPGKTEDWLMVTLEDNCSMWFGGSSGRPLAIVEVKVLGDSVDKAGAQQMTQKVSALFQRELAVDPKDLYVRYLASPDWGWNGANF